MIAIAAIPLLYLIKRGSEIDRESLTNLLLRDRTIEIYTTTLLLASIVLLFTFIVGSTFAWLIHNITLPFGSLPITLSVLPLAIPSYVLTYAWISIYPGFNGFWAAVLVLTLSTSPYVTLVAVASLRRIDFTQVEVGRSLGLSQLAVLRRVIWPQMRVSLSAGLLLVFLYVLSDFGAVSLLGVNTFTRNIYTMYRATFDRNGAAVISLALILLAIFIIALEFRLRGRRTVIKSNAGIIKTHVKISVGWLRWPLLTLIFTYALLALGVPFWVLTTRFIQNTESIDITSLISATFSTVIASFAGATLAMAFALPLGILLARRSGFIPKLAESSILLTHALPGVVIGLALVALSSNFPWIYQTLPVLAFAYAFLFLAKAVGSIRASLQRIAPILHDVSETLGITGLAAFQRVTLPLAAPGILIGFLLVLLTAMKELPATLMLRPTGYETLATEIWAATSISKFNEAAPYALVLIIIAAIPTFILTRPDKSDSQADSEGLIQ